MKCFRTIDKGEDGRHGIWIMTCDRGYHGIFFHGRRDEFQDPRWSVEQLIEEATSTGESFRICEAITTEQALEELRNWPEALLTAKEIIERNA